MPYKKYLLSFFYMIATVFVLSGCCISHQWTPANCTEPMTCTRCGKTEGRALGHIWEHATCTEAKFCPICGEKEGEPTGHDWKEATCEAPETCVNCGEIRGKALGHHWQEADCLKPKTCLICEITEGEALGHTWTEATQLEPKTCMVCGETVGEALGFVWEDLEELPGVFWYSSGAGGWGTSLTLEADGKFHGEYMDSEMGERDEKYPKGTVYTNTFEGRFTEPEYVDEHTFRFHVKVLKVTGRIGRESIRDEIRYVNAEPAGMEVTDTFYLYLPHKAVSELPEEFMTWSHIPMDSLELPDTFYGIYNEAAQAGFVGYPDQTEMPVDEEAEPDPTEQGEDWIYSEDQILAAVTSYLQTEKELTADDQEYSTRVDKSGEDGLIWVELVSEKTGKSVCWIGVDPVTGEAHDAMYEPVDLLSYFESNDT